MSIHPAYCPSTGYVIPARLMLDLAMVYAAQAVDWSRGYAHFRNEASLTTGRRRCQYAALAGHAKRKARSYAALHNAALASVRA